MLLKNTFNDLEDTTAFHTHHEPFKIKIRRNGKVNSPDAIIWPWAFPKPLKEFLRNDGNVIHLKAGESLALEEPANQLIVLIQGAIRVNSHTLKHRHHILEFYFSGDSFEYIHKSILGTAINYQIIQDSFIYIGPSNFAGALKKQHLEYSRFLLNQRQEEILRIQTHLSVLSVFNAQEKTAFFLVDMYRRLAVKKYLHLPMTRVDISHYLSLTPETVSRELNRFNQLGHVKLHRADIEFQNIKALVRLYH